MADSDIKTIYNTLRSLTMTFCHGSWYVLSLYVERNYWENR